jgi:type IV pilus assembly protein PilW
MTMTTHPSATQHPNLARTRNVRYGGHAKSGVRGLTMVELMVALTIALIILAAMAQLFASSRSAYTLDDGLARVQANGRFTFELLAEDIRQAGHFGCVSLPPNPDLVGNNPTSGAATVIYNDAARRGIQGYRYVGTGGSSLTTDWSPSLTTHGYWSGGDPAPRPYSDVLVVRYATSPGIHVTNTTPTNGPLNIPSTYSNTYNVGDVLMVTNCAKADVFVVTNVSTSGTDTTITHGTPTNTTPNLVSSYGIGAELMKYYTLVYYVADTARVDRTGQPVPALFRKVLSGNVVDPTALVAQELVEGVETLQFYFGTLSGPLTTSVPDRFVPADVVTDWSRVTSVRIGAVVATTENIGQSQDNSTNIDVIGLPGSTGANQIDDYNPRDDLHARRVFTSAILKRQPPKEPNRS